MVIGSFSMYNHKSIDACEADIKINNTLSYSCFNLFSNDVVLTSFLGHILEK